MPRVASLSSRAESREFRAFRHAVRLARDGKFVFHAFPPALQRGPSGMRESRAFVRRIARRRPANAQASVPDLRRIVPPRKAGDCAFL